jgi:hypothetical protein
MPTATDELRAEWGIGDEKAMEHLRGRGFVLHRDWSWSRPASGEVTDEDRRAISFLIQEWDMDGLRPAGG